MAHFEKHNETTLRLLGKDFTQVHAYLDQFYLVYGMSHRQLFHHQAGIELIVRKFGKEARAAAEIKWECLLYRKWLHAPKYSRAYRVDGEFSPTLYNVEMEAEGQIGSSTSCQQLLFT